MIIVNDNLKNLVALKKNLERERLRGLELMEKIEMRRERIESQSKNITLEKLKSKMS